MSGTTRGEDPLYFVAGMIEAGGAGPGRAHCLVRVHTPLGMPHVACVGHALGLRYLDLMSVKGRACLLQQGAITSGMNFDIDTYGVLVFEDDAALDAYIVDADGFDYRSRIRHPVLPVRSDDPW